jgi:hypothetical protein
LKDKEFNENLSNFITTNNLDLNRENNSMTSNNSDGLMEEKGVFHTENNNFYKNNTMSSTFNSTVGNILNTIPSYLGSKFQNFGNLTGTFQKSSFKNDNNNQNTNNSKNLTCFISNNRDKILHVNYNLYSRFMYSYQ